MEETEVIERPIDIDDLFGGETVVTQTIKECRVRFHFREIDARVDLELQKRVAKTTNRNGKTEASSDALTADLWLFGQVCTAVEVVTGEKVVPVPDFRERLSPDVKRNALFYYRQRISKADESGN